MSARVDFVAIANDLGSSRKVMALDDDTALAAIGLFVLCVGYCDRQRTDGAITAKAMTRAVAHGLEISDALTELVRVGFIDETPDGYRVHAYLDWQRSREEIEAAAVNARNAARKRWGNAKRNADSNASGNAKEREERERDKKETKPLARACAEEDGDEPSTAYFDFFRTWERVIGSVPSEATKRTLRAWVEVGYSNDAVEAALTTAIDKNAKAPAKYANTILRSGQQPKQPEPEPEPDLLKGAIW